MPHGLALGKEFFLKKIKNLCRVPSGLALGKENFQKKNKSSLPSVFRVGARQRIFFKKIKNLCRAPHGLALGKEILKKIKKIFAECLQGWHSAKWPSTRPAPWWSLFFAECPRGTRQIHSAKSVLPINFLSCVLCRVPHSAKALPSASGTRQRT